MGCVMIETAFDLGQRIKDRRRALGLTQRQLAMAINSGERFIVELEAGKPTCQIGKALAAARAVGIKLVDTSLLTAREDILDDDMAIQAPEL
jgi:y4mF family transcriptional regulator